MKLRHLLSIALLATAIVPSGQASEFRIFPALTVDQAYDDNLYNDPDDEVSEFVTRFRPSLGAEYEAPRLEFNAEYTLDQRFYLEGERDDETVHFFDGRVKTALIREAVFLEIADELSRISLDTARDYSEESLFLNQSDRNIFSVSPYLDYRLSPRYRLKTGYRFVKVDFEEDSGVDREDHVLFLEGERELTERTKASVGYQYIDETSDQLDHEKHDLWVGFRTEYAESSFVFGTLGYTWVDFSDGSSTDEPFWDFGITHNFTYLLATGVVGVQYVEDPQGTILREERYQISLFHEWNRLRGRIDAALYEYYDTEIDHLDTRRYTTAGSLIYDLTSRWTGNLGLSWDRFEEEVDDTETDRVIFNLGLGYEIATDFTASLNYYRIDSHSPELREDRYETNRFILEARKVF